MLAFFRLYAFEPKKRKKQQLSKGVKKKSVGLVAVKKQICGSESGASPTEEKGY